MLPIFLLAGGSVFAGPPRQVAWSELSFVTGRNVRVSMPEGAVISGKAMAVEQDALVVRIDRTTNQAVYPKGAYRVPRAGLKAPELRKKSYHWRIVSTALGGFAGLLGGALAAWGARGGNAANAVVFGIMAAGAAAGYALGDVADRHSTMIVIRD